MMTVSAFVASRPSTGRSGEIEILAGIPVVNEAHADLLMAACSHGAPKEFCQ